MPNNWHGSDLYIFLLWCNFTETHAFSTQYLYGVAVHTLKLAHVRKVCVASVKYNFSLIFEWCCCRTSYMCNVYIYNSCMIRHHLLLLKFYILAHKDNNSRCTTDAFGRASGTTKAYFIPDAINACLIVLFLLLGERGE